MPQAPPRLAAIVLCLCALAAPLASADCYVTLLHFNDFHGYLQPAGPPEASVGGLARIATLAREVRAWNDSHGNDTLFLEAGDILQGTPLSLIYQGEPDVRLPQPDGPAGDVPRQPRVRLRAGQLPAAGRVGEVPAALRQYLRQGHGPTLCAAVGRCSRCATGRAGPPSA